MNLNTKFYALCLAVLVVFSCSNDDDATIGGSNETAIDLVTGLIARPDAYSPGFRLGNPNIRMPASISSTTIIAFPNPIISAFSIQMAQTSEVINNIWLVKANANKIYQDTDFDEILSENTYTVSQIESVAETSFDGISSTNVTLDLGSFEAGYYRVFIKTDQSLYWDNIYINNDGVDITEFFDSWE